MFKKGRWIFVAVILLLVLDVILFAKNDNGELRTIKSEKELLSIYKGDKYNCEPNYLLEAITMPFSFFEMMDNGYSCGRKYRYYDAVYAVDDTVAKNAETSSKDYSTTNVQVENVDEADITKTDGDYIYSLSENKVIITDVRVPEEIKIASSIDMGNGEVPVDLLLYGNKLIVISEKKNDLYYDNNTVVNVFDITDRTKVLNIKNYEIYQPYFTSRVIDSRLYIFSSGRLHNYDDKINREYKENNVTKEIELDNIKYMKDIYSADETIISYMNLDNLNNDVSVNSYLIDMENAYVSENSIYVLNYNYVNNNIPISTMFGLKGVIGTFEYISDYIYDYDYTTSIYKFDFDSDGNIVYEAKNKVSGDIINQYSLDEKDGHLRVATYDDNGTKITIFNDNLKEIGKSDYVAKGERMYASRFIGDRAYLVTYKTMDPLFVFDLSDEKSPKVLGELKIPGYSTYLHPYDDNHIIGIGMETEEIVNKDINGRVISTSDRVIGMKMALFDVSNVNNPTQVSQVVIGDSRTTSAILTNPKALLFSKEKELIAIPVNNYSEDFNFEIGGDNYFTDSIYKIHSSDYIGEGYIVYNINLNEGFKQKGLITHDYGTNKNKYGYYYYTNNLLRGLFIEDNLYTISEREIKVNKLDNLELVSNLKLEEKGEYYE